MRFEPQIDALNLTPRMSPQGKDTNVCTMPQMTLYRDTYQLAQLTHDELALFKAQFTTLLTMPGSDERKIMLDRVEQYIIGLRAVKQKLSGVTFAGINAEDAELGMSYIRPQFTITAAAYRLTWVTPALGIVWADWLFGAALNPFMVGRDFGMVITHLKSLLTPTPIMSECRFVIGRSALLPIDVRNGMLADTENNISIVAIPTMILIPQQSFYARARADVAGTDTMALGGLVFGLGRALSQEVATWV